VLPPGVTDKLFVPEPENFFDDKKGSLHTVVYRLPDGSQADQ
jgi:hypothetical protein